MKKHFDYFLFFLVCGIVAFSSVFLFCLSIPESLQETGKPYYFFIHQMVSGLLVALIFGFVAYKVPLAFIKKIAPILVILNIIALFAVFIPGIGLRAGGASRWINIAGFTVQPSEFLKITAILYLSAWIASKLADTDVVGWKNNVKKNYHNIIYILAPFLCFLGVISIALYFQKDASTLGIISLTLLAIYFSSKTPIWHTLLIVLAGILFLLIIVKLEPYRVDRWLVFLHPEQDPLGKAFQLRQSIISIGSGGFFGKGLGMSAQKFAIPEAMTDSIFAIIGEEVGFFGCLILIGVFITLFWLGLKIYRNSSDKFSRLVAIGVVFWISLQALINMASVAGIFPVAGIPLPFFSYGGSHLAVELIGIGLLLNISKNT